MAASFSVVGPERSEDVVALLRDVFGFVGTPANFSTATVAWKYFDAHPWWPDGRSYALDVNGRLAAHACVSPVRFAIGGDVVDSMRIIDWAAGRFAPAAGVLLFRRCVELERGPLVMVGGSSEARQFVSRLKAFTKKPDMRMFSRPLHSLRLWQRSGHSGRDSAKLARNLYWEMRPLPSRRAWTCRRAFDGEPVFTPSGAFVPIVRTRAWLDYLLACPIGSPELLILEHRGRPAGHAFLSYLSGSTRIADFALGEQPSPDERTSAFSALIHYIKEQGRSVEVVTASSLPDNCAAFEACGMRFRTSKPVAAADPHVRLGLDLPLETNMMLGDAFYLHDPRRPFLT